jgi:hypothetical protein
MILPALQQNDMLCFILHLSIDSIKKVEHDIGNYSATYKELLKRQ